MTNEEFKEFAKKVVMEDTQNIHKDLTITLDDVMIVWSAKVLQNYKVIMANRVKGDRHIWEITHNGDKNETYVDMYDKVYNKKIEHGRKA